MKSLASFLPRTGDQDHPGGEISDASLDEIYA
jgi:hypothetical protein